MSQEYRKRIRNFCIIAHVDHGKSTLADRFLELTGTIEKRKMRAQALDRMDLERERGITIKMAPVRMVYRSHFDRRITQNGARNDAELLYEDLTYKIRGALFQVRKKIGLGHKEQVYHGALEIEFKNVGLAYESKKNIPILYEGQNIGIYQPDFVIENKVLIELKALPEIGRPQTEQVWSYLKGCEYKLALLINYGSTYLEIKRIVYDLARNSSALSASGPRMSAGVADQIENDEYILNLIDTPGHVDFSYEVSRALAAVEGAILLVDATQGVQAQTVAHLAIAQKLGKTILAVINKIDAPYARVEETEAEIRSLLGDVAPIFRVSAKTGEGVEALLKEVIDRVPSPAPAPALSNDGVDGAKTRALVFDSHFHPHNGVVAHVRISDGVFEKGVSTKLFAARLPFLIKEVGVFMPDPHPVASLSSGEIGYIATGIREPGKVMVGDTIGDSPLRGYQEPKPMIWLSVFSVSQKDFPLLNDALAKLRLTDSAFSYSQEASEALGKGFRCGFLGLLHSEIVLERLRREFRCDVVASLPSLAYEITTKKGETILIKDASRFPDAHDIQSVKEPWLSGELFTPARFLSSVQALLAKRKGEIGEVETLGEPGSKADVRVRVKFALPLRVFADRFFDELKRISEGYASLFYDITEYRSAQRADGQALLCRIDMFVAGERIEGLSRVVAVEDRDRIARAAIDRLRDLLPRQLFSVKIQAISGGAIIAALSVAALRKHVTGNLYGGDRSRKMKLWQKQKKGKKRLLSHGRVAIPPEVFIKMAQ